MTETNVNDVVAAADLGRPSARKSGRNAAWPYVPVLIEDGHVRQLLGLAFKTRDEAIACATRHVDAERADLAAKLVDPRYRALRRHHGLPEEITQREATR